MPSHQDEPVAASQAGETGLANGETRGAAARPFSHVLDEFDDAWDKASPEEQVTLAQGPDTEPEVA